jgi:hypothetical protein
MIDLPELAGKMAESLVDLMLLEAQQGQMLAEAISQLGNAFLEKSGAIEGESDTEHWGGFLAAKERQSPGPAMTRGNKGEADEPSVPLKIIFSTLKSLRRCASVRC